VSAKKPKMRVAINGFGRIGRTLARILLSHPHLELVAIHDVAEPQVMAHLFKYDSIHGTWPGSVVAESDGIRLNDHSVRYLRALPLEDLPWKSLHVDAVVDCTGMHKDLHALEMNLQRGAKRVLLSAPSEDAHIPTYIAGITPISLLGQHSIISCASCTTNNAAPMIQLVDELYGIQSCFVTTVHSYTGDQRLHDAPHKDLRRSRAAVQSIIPTTTGAAKALTRVFPHLSDVMGGCGIRVPVPNGSLTDITCAVRHVPTAAEVNNAFRQAAEVRWAGILKYTDDPIVSSDIRNESFSCIFDALLTSVVGNMVKVVGWYDNESGYSHRLAGVLVHWSRQAQET
jgi:glyceraldehyde 3-phosphate dehydrogenase